MVQFRSSPGRERKEQNGFDGPKGSLPGPRLQLLWASKEENGEKVRGGTSEGLCNTIWSVERNGKGENVSKPYGNHQKSCFLNPGMGEGERGLEKSRPRVRQLKKERNTEKRVHSPRPDPGIKGVARRG